MKISIAALMIFFSISFFSSAQAPEWKWANNNGGGAADFAYGTAIDGSGNVYYCGSFYSAHATFGSSTIESAGLGDGFLCKYDSNGNFLWVKTITGTATEACQKVAVNDKGDVFVMGYSEGDFSADDISFTSLGEDDAFVAKYSSSGVLKWIKRFGGAGEDYPYSLALDGNGRCVVVGTFEHSISIGNVTLTSQNDSLYDAFIAKFDKKGNLLWATSAGGPTEAAYVYPSDVVVDVQGGIFVTGTYTGPVNFGDNSLTSVEEAFLVKLSSQGIFKWAVDAGSRCYYTHVGADTASNIYVTGSFGAYGNPSHIGNFTLTPDGEYMDVYLAKFNSLGIVQNVVTGGSDKNDFAGGLAVNAAGETWITGYALGSPVTFGSQSFTGSGKADVFVTSCDTSGNVKWLMKAGGSNEDHAFDLAYDGSSALSIAGTFKTQITMGPITLNAPSSSADAWLGKISIGGLMRTESTSGATFNAEVYPNPSGNFLLVKSDHGEELDLMIFNEEGKLELSTSMDCNESIIDVSSLPAGAYILQITSAGKKSVTKFLKQ